MKTIRIFTAALAALAASSAFAFDFNDDEAQWTTENCPEPYIFSPRNMGFRPTSISADREQTGTTMVTASWVANTGTHKKTFVYLTDQTAAQLNAIAADGYRIQDVAVYRKDNVKKYAVLAFSAASDPAPTQWFDELTQAQLATALSSYQGRLLDFDAQMVGNEVRFSGVMRKNTGGDQIGWWYTPGGATWEQIGDVIESKKTRLVDLCRLPNGKYYAAYWTDYAGGFKFFGDATLAQMYKGANRNGMRVQSLSHRMVNGQPRYSGVLVHTEDPLTRKVGNWMRARTDGDIGIYLRRIDGPVMADLQEDLSFYPSSTMKVFMHAYAIWNTPQADLMTRQIPVWNDHNDLDHTGDTFTNTPLPQVLGPMMWNSSNQMANTCIDFWGANNIVNFCRNTLGASSKTQINHLIGIGRPYSGDTFNSTTLVDLGNVYENVNGKYGATKLNFFKTYMLNDVNSNGMDAAANDARTALGITNAQWNAWRTSYSWHAKAGSNPCPGKDFNGYSSVGGYLTLPFKDATTGRITVRKYVFGTWVNDAKEINDAGAWASATELIRDEVTASLASFK